ncbi:hypothetical protein GpartN1_g4572.t1 [Galdieria partita]|uniref:Glycerol-3-phosphate dehydrogenase n=1 Tax=Galdieria partita TaxID=83374 RepID=A0A9C7PZK2_9RHOD|nr:hypothetical protein GpartN1_g4572.t1 [Galdieria partita]
MGAFRKTLLFVGGGILAVGALGATIIGTSSSAAPFARVDYKEGSNDGKSAVRLPPLESVPSRQKQLESLRSSSQEQNSLDILVIGGGATGSGVALDAALRGLSVGLVERDDFASGTSSRSTKLIHGGVRYLEKAFFNLDPKQLGLVFEALHERAIMLKQAPHLTHPLPTILPCYQWWEVPFYWIGLKFYDAIAAVGHGSLYLSKHYSSVEARRLFPTLSPLRADKKPLRGAIVYFDGQMNDARVNISVALTAALYGAAVANHTEVIGLLKNSQNGKVIGARVRDRLNGEEFDIHAKVVVNAAGPFSDSIHHMVNPTSSDIIAPSSGVHVTLPSYYSPDGMGLIVPKTKDGRVVFMLPWLGSTIAGTTDSSTEITELPQPHEDEIAFILEAIRDYLNVQVRREDVKSAWSGIRPLARDPRAKDTQNILRDHLVFASPEGLVTVAGGKWTTYRRMAQDTVDKAIQVGQLKPQDSCKTPYVQLIGSHSWDPSYFTFLVQNYRRLKYTVSKSMSPSVGELDIDCAKHLSTSYGDQAYKVCELAQQGWGKRLVHGYPVLEAEIVYCAQNEYCFTAADFLARRCRLAFLDAEAANQALPRVVEILGDIYDWSSRRREEELEQGRRFLASFLGGRTEPKLKQVT